MTDSARPGWVTLALFGLKTRRAAMAFVGISFGLAACCLIMGMIFFLGSAQMSLLWLFVSVAALLAGIWYWLAIAESDRNHWWKTS